MLVTFHSFVVSGLLEFQLKALRLAVSTAKHDAMTYFWWGPRWNPGCCSFSLLPFFSAYSFASLVRMELEASQMLSLLYSLSSRVTALHFANRIWYPMLVFVVVVVVAAEDEIAIATVAGELRNR
jgi:hypothetical protein